LGVILKKEALSGAKKEKVWVGWWGKGYGIKNANRTQIMGLREMKYK